MDTVELENEVSPGVEHSKWRSGLRLEEEACKQECHSFSRVFAKDILWAVEKEAC